MMLAPVVIAQFSEGPWWWGRLSWIDVLLGGAYLMEATTSEDMAAS